MKKEFDFNDIGKRMPYRMPEGFMKTMQDNVMNSIGSPSETCYRNGGKIVHVLFRSMVAAAAVAILFTVSFNTASKDVKYDTSQDIDMAFDNLSYEDQAYMIEVSENDVFYASAE